MKPGDVLHGFQLKYSQPLDEIKAVLHRFTYVKNGADTIWLERDDDNKSFAIAFRTVPSDRKSFSAISRLDSPNPFSSIHIAITA